MADEAQKPPPLVSFREAFLFWLKLGFINFGGPTGQIAIMHQELVERRRWISEARFLHALNYCMLLPGPEAQQLAVYVGWLLHRTLGGLVAGIFFVLPGALLMLALSWTYVEHGNVAWIAAIFYGLRAAVIAIVATAVLRIGSKALKNGAMVAIAAAAFVAIFLFKMPFPAIVVGAGLLGLLGSRLAPQWFAVAAAHGGKAGSGSAAASVLHDDAPPPEHARPSLWRFVRCVAIGVLAWFGPLLLIAWWERTMSGGGGGGGSGVLAQEATFFSKCALVTFGGAYAVLAYISQAAVETYHWMLAPQMLDGLGLAESTPGPLILVTQFVGFVGAYNSTTASATAASSLSPAMLGVVGSFVTLWATFAPCFLWIFAGAPFIEQLRGQKTLNAALSVITASVVGVVLNLSVWLGLKTLFHATQERRAFGMTLLTPDVMTVDLFALAIAVVAFVGMRRFKWGIIPVVIGGALLGLLWKLLGPGA